MELGVKFLCDRCKTRYSIGDDRVRGKILKIRCKNCGNVITVREGMTADGPDPDAQRRGRPTTAAPPAQTAQHITQPLPPGNGASKAPAPAALEEEWYVSIDGDQEGPYSLAEAQKWVAAKPLDAELHCWSEGFDDWMPVDKVSHFRSIRRRAASAPPPAAPAPPPIPRVTAGAKPQVPRTEDTPKPLFAATMAAIEKSAAEPARAGNGAAAKTTGKLRTGTVQGLGAGPLQALAAFEPEPADSMTAVETPPFLADPPTTAEPVAAKRAAALAGAPAPAPVPAPPVIATPPPADAAADDDDDNLEIGEVSRVVNLADLMRAGQQQREARAAAARPSAPIPLARATGAVPKLPAAEIAAGAPGLPGDPAAIGPGESIVASAPAVAEQRRGFVILLVVAAVLLLGATGVVLWKVTSNGGDAGPVVLRQNGEVNTDQPDVIVRTPIIVAGSAAPREPDRQPVHHWIATPQHDTLETPSSDPNHRALDGDEIQDEASKQAEMTNRCYMRAQRGVDAITIGDVKRIDATLTIDKAGIVTDVRLSSHSGDTLGKCLIARLRAWRFRENPGGIFRITLAFANG